MIINYISDLNFPVIYRNPVDDAAATSSIISILDRFGKTYEIVDIPLTFDFSSIDNLLNGRDTIVLGGPIVNRFSHGLQNSWRYWIPDPIYPQLEAAGAVEVIFSSPTFFDLPAFFDGTQTSDTGAPDVIFGDTVTLDRYSRTRSLDETTYTDYAVMLYLRGTTNNLLFIAGIRDFGTLAGLFILDWITRDPIEWPYGLPNPVAGWQTHFTAKDAGLIQFDLSSLINTISSEDFRTIINSAGIRPTILNNP